MVLFFFTWPPGRSKLHFSVFFLFFFKLSLLVIELNRFLVLPAEFRVPTETSSSTTFYEQTRGVYSQPRSCPQICSESSLILKPETPIKGENGRAYVIRGCPLHPPPRPAVWGEEAGPTVISSCSHRGCGH